MILGFTHNEDGELVERVVQNDDGSVDVINYENGIEVNTERIVEAYPPLDPAGALATLLVVEGVLPLQDAANAIGQEPEHLVAEAEAWSLSIPSV
jgi:hypothetical protein